MRVNNPNARIERRLASDEQEAAPCSTRRIAMAALVRHALIVRAHGCLPPLPPSRVGHPSGESDRSPPSSGRRRTARSLRPRRTSPGRSARASTSSALRVRHADERAQWTRSHASACAMPQGFLPVEARDQIKGHYCGPAVGQVIANYTWAMAAGWQQVHRRRRSPAGWAPTSTAWTSSRSLANGLETATRGAPAPAGRLAVGGDATRRQRPRRSAPETSCRDSSGRTSAARRCRWRSR